MREGGLSWCCLDDFDGSDSVNHVSFRSKIDSIGVIRENWEREGDGLLVRLDFSTDLTETNEILVILGKLSITVSISVEAVKKAVLAKVDSST